MVHCKYNYAVIPSITNLMRGLFRHLLNYCRRKTTRIHPRLFVFLGTRIFPTRSHSNWKNRVNSLSLGADNQKPNGSSTAEILIVVTKKDFELMDYSLDFAINSVSLFQLIGIHLIVPDKHYDEAKKITQQILPQVVVHPESQYLSVTNFDLLSKKFENRLGWVVQQLLKILYSSQSKADFVLVVDADTILLESRPWLQADSKQLLSLSEERHNPYYDVLDSLGVGNRRDYSFITHHMVYQPWVWKEILRTIEVTDQDTLTTKVLSLPLNSESPFSLDYEMYGQYLLANYPEMVELRKWSNFECSLRDLSERAMRETLAGHYYSISIHSWKKNHSDSIG
jgi:hypothetical protein